MNKWKEYKLSELCIDVSYGYTASTLVENTGYKFLRITDIQGGNVTWNNVPYCKISEKHYSKYQLKTGDIVIARTGNSTGESYIFDENIFNGKAVFASYLIRYRIDEKIAIPYYIWLCLRTSRWWNFVFNSASGSAQKGANAKVLGNFSINLPNIQQQFRIANFFHNINRKIVLNTQTNQTLEQIAQGIFKHWFIDFAPVHAKANALARGETIEQAELAAMACLSGKTAEKITALQTQDPTTYHQLQQTAAAFPSEFVETEMGQVPKGWEICSITDKRVCSIIKPKIHHFSGEKDYIATANVSQNTIVGELEKITFDNRPSRANMQPIVDSIWFAKMVGEHKAIMIDENDEFLLKNTILSTGFLGIKPQQYKKCFLYCFINSENFTLLKNSLATGAVQIALNNTSFSSMNIILPSDNVLEYFENKVSTLFSKIAANHRENKSLAETRDLLLPKLLNGEIEL